MDSRPLPKNRQTALLPPPSNVNSFHWGRSPAGFTLPGGGDRSHLTTRRPPIRFDRLFLLTRLIVLVSLSRLSASAQDVAEIIQKSIEANNRDWNANIQFDNFETDRIGQGSRTFDVTFLFGSPYQRLVAVNGEELTGDQKAAEQRKFDQALSQRKAESAEQRSKRLAKYEADRRRDHVMLEQLTTAFNFTLQGEQQLGPYSVYVLKATPRPGYRPPNRDSRVLPGMEGTLWIDKSSFQWVKVEAHVIRPVQIEGFVAKVEPGTRFELETMPVEGDIWLPKHYTMNANAKLLGIISHHSQEDDTYFNYRRHTSSEDSGPQPPALSDHNSTPKSP
jgi:hypothetical protein